MLNAKPFARAVNKQKGERLGLFCLYLRTSPDGEVLFHTGGPELYSLSKSDLGENLADDLLSTIDPSIAGDHKQHLPAIKQLFQQHKDLLGDQGDLRYNTRVAEHTVFRIHETP
eukprot:2881364-Rhodomonas_salina.1